MPPQHVINVLSRRQRLLLVGLLVVSMAATSLVLFGPARGARIDLGRVHDDVHVTRRGIATSVEVQQRTLDELTAQLRTTKDSLEVQQQGLDVATASQRLAGSTARSTATIRLRTDATLDTIRQVLTALGPLRQLRGEMTDVVQGVQAGVALARSTLEVGRQALQDGRKALQVASRTLETLQRSEQVQRDLLAVGRRTLEQVEQINRKLPLPAVFPTGTPGRERAEAGD